MAKRRLNQRQIARIKEVQQRRKERARARDARALDGQLGAEQTGLVTANYGTRLVVEAPTGALVQCRLRQNIDTIVCGDRVVWQPILGTEQAGIVVALTDRQSVLVKADASGQSKPVAANIDQVAIIVAPVPELSESLIDRYLVSLESLQIAPLLVFNKTDLLDAKARRDIQSRLAIYRQIGYPLLEVSSKRSIGLDSLRARLADRTNVLVGQSGVGKSSLINALIPDLEIRTQALSAATGLGTHTTTTSMLYHLDDGGDLIDSPGVRSFEPIDVAASDLVQGFIEFQPWLGQCRFANCRHSSEPECALLQAAKAGEISDRRLASYQQMLNNLLTRERAY